MTDPRAPTTDEEADLAAHFDVTARTELGLAIALFCGFSKMLIVLGLEPAGPMDPLVVTTPEIPEGVDVSALPTEPRRDDPHVAMLADHPRLAALWQHMVVALDEQEWLPGDVLETCRNRVATLHGVDWAVTDAAATGPLVDACVAVAEMFAVDVHAVTDEMADRVSELVGPEGLTTLAAALAIWEGFYRLAATWAWEPGVAVH